MGRSNKTIIPDATSDSEEVGYGKPPRRHQFKPGQSGNPKGRRKGATSAATLFRNLFEERIEIVEGGRKRKLPRFEVLVRQLVTKAHKGDPKAVAQILTVGRELGIIKPEPVSVDPDAQAKLASEDLMILRRAFPDRDFGDEE